MTDITTAYAKIEAMHRTQSGNQRAAWDAIKSETPDVAEFLTQVNKAAFGKPAAVEVVIGGRIVVEKGVLLPAKPSRFNPPWMR